MTKGRRPCVLYTYMDVVHGQDTLVTRYDSIDPVDESKRIAEYHPAKLNLDAYSAVTNRHDAFEVLNNLRLLQRIAFKDKQDEPN